MKQQLQSFLVSQRRRVGNIAALSLAASALVAGGAWAQGDRAHIEEVVVVAEKRAENLQSVPSAVSAFSQDTLESIGAYEFKEAANFVPNVIIREQPGSGVNYAFGLRGVTAGETALAVDNPVGLYVDDVYLGRLTGTAIDNIEIERMEVLRGPQGTLYGRNSVGGAINLISRKPSGEFGLRNRLTVGSDQIRNQFRVDFDTWDIGDSQLAVQVNLLYASQDAALDVAQDLTQPMVVATDDPLDFTAAASDASQSATLEPESASKDQTAFRVALNWDFTDNFSADLIYNFSKVEGLSDRQQLVAVPGGGSGGTDGIIQSATYPIFSALAPLARQERQDSLTGLAFLAEEVTENSGLALTLNWELDNGMAFKSITAMRNYDGAKGNANIRPAIGVDFGSARVAPVTPTGTYGYASPTSTGTAFFQNTGDGVVVDPQDLLGGGWTTVGNPVPEGTLVSLFRAGREGEQSQFSQEFQWSGDIGEQIDFVAGLYYFQEETDELNPQYSLSPGLFYAGIVGASFTPEVTGLLTALGTASATGDFAEVGRIAGMLATMDATIDPSGLGACGGRYTEGYVAPCFNSSVVGGNPDFAYGTDNTALAVYGHVRYQITEQLELGVGLRYTQDEREGYLNTAANASTDSEGNRLGADERLTGEDDYDKLDYSVSLGYQVNEGLNVYGKVATGYRSGGFNVRAASADVFRKPVEDENLLSLELGLKSDFWDGRGRANIAVFQSQYTDRQISLFSAGIYGATSVISNAGELDITGVELELTLLPVDGLTLNLNVGMLEVEIVKWNEDIGPNPAGTECGDTTYSAGTTDADLVACRFPAYSPELSWSAIVRYDFEQFAWGQLSLVLDANYQDQYTFTSAQNPDTSVTAIGDDRTLIGARASLSDIDLGPGALTVSLWGENIAGEDYKEFPIDFGSFAVASYGREASFGFDLQYDF